MTGTGKKTKRKLKRTVRKTFGALFLTSALVVAAIPVDNLRAVSTGIKVGVDNKNCRIPIIAEEEPIYTTGDGMFQFAYVLTNDVSSGNKIAVILGYDGGMREGGVLTIPNEVDAYLKYTEPGSDAYGYCAVGQDGDYLFYGEVVNKTDENGNLVYESNDDSGESIGIREPLKVTEYHPCYYLDRDKWEKFADDELFYQNGMKTVNGEEVVNYVNTTAGSKQRIKDAAVKYIGNQTLRAGLNEESGTWSIVPESQGGIVDSPEEGIFRGEKSGNISTLYVGNELSGIGDYAFYGCTNLSSIQLSNGLDTIGNYAFANCVNLETVDIDITAMLSTIGHHAFYNCRGLTEFVMPRQVNAVGDSTFEGCSALKSVDLCGQGKNVQLNELGYSVFKNCSKLESLTLPDSYSEDNLSLGLLEGCTSLQHVTANNKDVSFVENAEEGFTFEEFKETVPATFYFEGLKVSNLHDLAADKGISFKYMDSDVYEIVVKSADKSSLYQVNSNNELIYCSIPEGAKEVEIPKTVGPYQIKAVNSASFQGLCSIEKVSIPSSIETIDANAFKGCHNLKTVIFQEPVGITSIGSNAFQTQDVTEHKSGCNGTLEQEPILQFVGSISNDSVPFQYAMDPNNNINVGSQVRSYITFYGSWPENLQVRYNPETEKTELVDYITFNDLKNLKSMTKTAAMEKYPCMLSSNADDYMAAASNAVDKYGENPVNTAPMTDYEKSIVSAVENIILPEGIESIQSGLFKTKEAADVNYGVSKKLETYGVEEIESKAFEKCDNFKEVGLYGAIKKVGDKAFKDCTNLSAVTISGEVNKMGVAPFTGCSKLKNVNFSSDADYVCDNSIIYELDDEGKKEKVVEYLEGRASGVVSAEELAGIKSLEKEAFRGTNVSYVDLQDSEITEVPKRAFSDTSNLSYVYLPRSWQGIDESAFADSNLQYLEIPGSQGVIDNSAFDNHSPSLTFKCEEGSNARYYASKNNILVTDREKEEIYTVRFWDSEKNLLKTEEVKSGLDATPPEAPEMEGYDFVEWVPDYHGISRESDIIAKYKAVDPDANKLTVTFLDYDGTELDTQLVAPGKDAVAPADPVRVGYVFSGWIPAITNVTENIKPVAQYIPSEDKFTVRFLDSDGTTVLYTQLVEPGKDAIEPKDPVKADYDFVGWMPEPKNITKDIDVYAKYEKKSGSSSGSNNNSGNGSDNNGSNSGSGNGNNNGNSNSGTGNNNGGTNNSGNNGTTNAKFYTLTVKNGSGSGSYVAGSQPIIVASDPASGQEFDKWTVDPADTKIASQSLSATLITMPEKDVTVTAVYKAKSGSSTGNGNTTTGNGTVNNTTTTVPGNNTVTHKGGTSVVIDKNGLSNTGVVAAAIKGSSDNFTIKVSESSEAAENSVRALQAEFGDLEGIKYFPMDISLYDSTGKTKITDTTGLSIQVTLPLPDSLIAYAGNNKVASVKDGKLEKLNAKFTTISGVACITFTAEHFSPYVIYADTNNLIAGTVTDSTPKTGDGIHPKWFLSLGLASISALLFMKTDRKKKVVKKAA